jgi:cytidylate kinase
MPIIIISSDSYQQGRQIALMTAEGLDYSQLDREILKILAEKYSLSEEKLRRAMDERPSLLGMSAKAQTLYLAYIEEAVLAKLSEDRVVCHGLGAHLYVRGLSHAFKVRVLADPRELIQAMIKEKGLSPEKAAKDAKYEETLRSRWSLDFYRADETSPSLYDLVINLSQIVPEEAVRMIIESSSHPKFKPTTYSVKCLKDMELASRVRVALLDHFPDVTVQADGAAVVIETTAVPREKEKKVEAIEKLARSVPGIGHVEVHVASDIIRQAAESFR